MILSSRIKNKVYIYTQDLDNAGGTKYWSKSKFNSLNTLSSMSDEAEYMLRLIDELSVNGRKWQINDIEIDCDVKFNGDCLITIKPNTLDLSGRTSPILILFNVLSFSKKVGVILLPQVDRVVGRKLSEQDKMQSENLALFLQSCNFYLFSHILFKSKKRKHND